MGYWGVQRTQFLGQAESEVQGQTEFWGSKVGGRQNLRSRGGGRQNFRAAGWRQTESEVQGQWQAEFWGSRVEAGRI